jgi:hypothetical protein
VTQERETAENRAKAQEERRNLKRELVESLPKFLLNVLIVAGIILVYVFLLPWFRVLDTFPLLDIVNFETETVITGYSLLQCGVLLIILLFGVEALKEFAIFANAASDFVISRLPGMRSADRGTVRRIPLDVIYLLFVVIIYTLIQPVFLPGVFPIAAFADIFQKLAVGLAVFFLLLFVYDLAKSIQKSAKRGIDDFGKRVANHIKDDEGTAKGGRRR